MSLLVIAIIILFFMVLRLSARVSELEQRITSSSLDSTASSASVSASAEPSPREPAPTTGSLSGVPSPTPAPTTPTPQVVYQPAAVRATELPVTDHGPDWMEQFAAWLGDNTLIKIGAFFFFLGAIWFVSFAIGQGWISEWLRVVLAIGLGIGVAALGHVRYHRAADDATEYNTLTVLGGAIVIGAIYAGQFLYLQFPPLLALLLLVVTIVYLVAVSVRTQTEWLASVAALASIVAPLLVNEAEPSVVGFFGYLFVMALGVGAVVYVTTWRTPLLTMVIGTYGYLLTAPSDSADAVLWIFTIWFALLFFASTSVSLFRTREPHPLDLTIIGSTTIFFAYMAHQFALVPAAALFIAALVTAAVGYLFRLDGLPDRITVVYAAAALFSLFVGTSLLFSGYTLALAFTFEVAVLLCAGVRLGFSVKTLGTLSALWLLPIVYTVPLLYAPEWERGVVHSAGVAAYLLAVAIGTTALFTLQAYRTTSAPHLFSIASYLTGLTWVVAVVVWGVFCYWLNPATDDGWYVLAYLGWLGLSLSGMVLAAQRILPHQWFASALTTGLLPALASFVSVGSRRWNEGVLHIDALGLVVITLVIGLFAVVSYRPKEVRSDDDLRTLVGGALSMFFMYATVLIWLVSTALVDTTVLTLTLALTGNTLLSYFLFVFLFRTGAPSTWSLAAVWSLLVPVLYSLTVLVTPWDSVAEPHAVALYVLVTVMGLIAITLMAEPASESTERPAQQTAIATLCIGIALYAVRIVWLATHTVFADDDYAVTAALLIYTLAGLLAYVYGNQTNNRSVKLAGTLLLALVIGRLLLIEVWSMELLWRVITFLGVGGLFIAAALFERDHQSGVPPPEHPPQ